MITSAYFQVCKHVHHRHSLIGEMMYSLKRTVVIILALLGIAPATAQIIPQPQEQIIKEGTFPLNETTTVYTNLKGKPRTLLLNYINAMPVKMKLGKTASTHNGVNLILTPIGDKGKEAYELSVTPQNTTIKANTDCGLFYGLQSLLQLGGQLNLPDQHSASTQLLIPCCTIKDAPRFGYRGFMLDVGSHFYPKEFIMRQMDLMAYYKLNTFHFHLAENGGWRIEIKKYPQLTREAAYRKDEPDSKYRWHWDFYHMDTPGAYGGYYTQKDIREIVDYASARHITIIPEIDIPGHNYEVLKAMPELACQGYDYHTSDELCVGKETTYRFCSNVLREIASLFPGEYIHIGGDEANRSHWANCPDCQRLMQREGIKDVAQLQGYFTRRIEKIVNALGKNIIGWDDILDGDISQNATVMTWHPQISSSYKKPLQPGYDDWLPSCPLDGTATGHKVIMTPVTHCYLDYKQRENQTAHAGLVTYLPLHDSYEYDPTGEGIKNPSLVLGVQGNLWCGRIKTEKEAEFQTYPRLMALAEVGWTQPVHKSWPDFYRRMKVARSRMQNAGMTPYDDTQDMATRRAERKAQHVILIGIDGWASASMDSADMPTVRQLMRDGCYTLKKRSVLPSASAINWASMMMGSMTEVAGYTKWNSRVPEIPSPVVTNHGMFPTIFTLLDEQYPEDFSAAVYDWDGIHYVIDSAAVTRDVYFSKGKSSAGYPTPDGIAEEGARIIKEHKPTLMLCYFGALDAAGHTKGWYSPTYYSVEHQLDGAIARIVQATKDAGIYDDTIFILSADHGGKDKGHGGITLLEMESPFIICGKNVRQSGMFYQLMTQADVAPTIAKILNITVPQLYWTGRSIPGLFIK